MAKGPLFRITINLREAVSGPFNTRPLLVAIVRSVGEVAPVLMKDLCDRIGYDYRAPYRDAKVFEGLFQFEIRGGERESRVTVMELQADGNFLVPVAQDKSQRLIRRAFREAVKDCMPTLSRLPVNRFNFLPFDPDTFRTERSPEPSEASANHRIHDYFGVPM